MAHFGLLCPPVSGHLNPTCALGHELLGRGHRVTLLALADSRPHAEAAGLEFFPLGAREFPPGQVAQDRETLGRLSGWRGLQFTRKLFERETEIHLREVAAAAGTLRLDALLVDQISPAGGTAADIAGLPFITLCNALLLDQEPAVPPCIVRWPYRPQRWARVRNRLGHAALNFATAGVRSKINAHRRRHGLPVCRHPGELTSRVAQLCQIPAEFDFPRERTSPTRHFIGPLARSDSRPPVPFPFERLDGRPLVYASMGTLQNGRPELFRTIAAACAGHPVQLVMSLGRPEAVPPRDLPGSPLVVPYAPQLELLQRAAMVITHAGLNTVMESLSQAVPLVAVPITNDQPGVAARIEWTGTGVMLPPARLNAPRLHDAVQQVLHGDSFRRQAQRLRTAIEQAGGLRRAADIVEQALAVGRPVASAKLVPAE